LLIAGLVPGLLSLAFTAKVMTMVHSERDGRTEFGRESYSGAQRAFAENRRFNLLETWIAPYDVGTAQYRLGDFVGAERSFQEALRVVPDREECRVRINLAVTVEALGDQALAEGRLTVARSAWRTALRTLEAGDCSPGSAAAGHGPGSATAEQGADANTVASRLRDKLDESEPPPKSERPESASSAELLARLNERAERIRHRAEQHQRDKADHPHSDQPSNPSDPPIPPSYHW
jgi:hypothetical protein